MTSHSALPNHGSAHSLHMDTRIPSLTIYFLCRHLRTSYPGPTCGRRRQRASAGPVGPLDCGERPQPSAGVGSGSRGGLVGPRAGGLEECLHAVGGLLLTGGGPA